MSPLPWAPDAQYIHGPDGHRFLAVCDPGDSAFICKAVNNHDALVAALESMLEIATRYCSHGDELGGEYNDAELAKVRALLGSLDTP